MDITYVSTGRFPTERAFGYATMKLCEELGALGHRVVLVIPKRRNDIGVDPFEYYNIKHTFTIEQLTASDRVDGARMQIPFAHWLDLWSFARAVSRAKLAGRTGMFYTREFMLLPFLPKARTVLELHSIPERKFIFLRVIRRAHQIVAISHGIKNEVVRLGVSPEKLLVAPDGVDTEAFKNLPEVHEARRTLGLPVDARIALYAGHFYDWKGADVFAAAAHLVPNVHCVLVGGVDAEYEKMKTGFGGVKNITILPFQKREKIPLFLTAADVLVLPNKSGSDISAKYTSPLKLFEYMAAGKPIVASNLESIKEILSERNAFFIAPDDPQALAQGITLALESTTEAEHRAAQARKDVERYTWGARAAAIAAFVQD